MLSHFSTADVSQLLRAAQSGNPSCWVLMVSGKNLDSEDPRKMLPLLYVGQVVHCIVDTTHLRSPYGSLGSEDWCMRRLFAFSSLPGIHRFREKASINKQASDFNENEHTRSLLHSHQHIAQERVEVSWGTERIPLSPQKQHQGYSLNIQKSITIILC